MEENNSIENINNSKSCAKISLSELTEKYKVSRRQVNVRIKHLGITTRKIKGKAYLDADQVAQMDGLDEHIKATGGMKGYLVPEPSKPREEEPEQTTAIAVSACEHLYDSPNYTEKEERYLRQALPKQATNQEQAIASLLQYAQEKAAGILIAENVLVQHYIENPELLPDDLKAKIAESAERPKIDFDAYVNSIINKINTGGRLNFLSDRNPPRKK